MNFLRIIREETENDSARKGAFKPLTDKLKNNAAEGPKFSRKGDVWNRAILMFLGLLNSKLNYEA